MRGKLERFEDNKHRDNLLEPGKALFGLLKGRWGTDWFKNDHPILLEIGAGRGEYSLFFARENKQMNMVAVDIKGDRLWKGSGEAIEEGLTNVAFLRTRIEDIADHFSRGEVNEIWIPFPGPRPKEKQAKKRLTSPRFLDLYRTILAPAGKIHVKTDSTLLYDYTIGVLREQKDVRVLYATDDLYKEDREGPAQAVQTRFEQKALMRGETIKYITFQFGK